MAYQGRDDLLLKNLAVTYPMGNLIGSVIAPTRSVNKDADSVYKDTDESGDTISDYAEGIPTNTVTFGMGDVYSYKTVRHGANRIVLDKGVANESKILKTLARDTIKLTRQIRNTHERSVNTIMTDSTKVTISATLTTTDQINNASYAKNFITKYIPSAKKTIRGNTGQIPNTIVVPYEVGLYWAASGEITDQLKYAYGKEFLEGNVWAQNAFNIGLPPTIQGLRVVIAGTRLNSANKGQTKSITDIWGKDIWIGYVADTTYEDTFGLITMEYKPFNVMKERSTDPKGTKIIVDWDYDIMEADLNTWLRFKDVIA